jgi:hypothetical protein
MSRFIAFAAVAAVMAGCSDAPVAPKSVHATAPSFAGTPPPPPVTGFGIGSFSAGPGGEELAAVAPPCEEGVAASHTTFDYVYTTDAADPIGMNQVAHIKFDGDLSHQITIHQKGNDPSTEVVDAEGIIAGTDDIGTEFSFRIISSKPTTGGMMPPPGVFDIDVRGVLKTPDGSCETSANFFGHFSIVSPSP